MPVDVAEPGAGARIVEAAMGRFGRIDTLVNNAGIFIAKPFTDYTDEDYDAVTGVNLARLLRGVPQCHRRDARPGTAAATWSTSRPASSITPIPQVPSALASLTKGGLNAATKSLAIEYAGRGIRVQRRRTGRHPHPDAPTRDIRRARGLHPLGRIGEIDDVVDAIIYLENAPFVTGDILHVDGGQSAGH